MRPTYARARPGRRRGRLLDDRSVSVWVVAPTWVVTNDYYGHSSRHYVAGHYETHNDRRWVASHGHDNRGHEVARGYGNERHDNNNNRRDDRRDHR